MSFRVSSKTLFGAAAIVVFGASLASAQARPTSTRRIPISKEQGGEVAKTDTVTIYRTDTLRLTTQLPGRVDTIRTTMTNTVTRYDTVTMAPAIRLPDGLYFGIGGGAMAPNGSLYNTNGAGWTAQAQIGYEGAKSLFGIRGDVNYAQPGEDGRYGAGANPDIMNISGDLKLNLPFFTHLFGATHRFGIYGIGGYTYTRYKNLPLRIDGLGAQGQILTVQGSPDWQDFHGWNAGAGMQLGWGRTQLFLESRVMAFNPENAPQARQQPFVFGINFF